MNPLQILGYVGLSVSILVGIVLFIKIILLMCKTPPQYFDDDDDDDDDEERKEKKKKSNNTHHNYETKEGSIETASMCSEECELLDKKRRQQEHEQSTTIKTHSKSESQMMGEGIELLETFQKGSSNSFSNNKSHSNSNSDSGFSNQASRSGVSTVWCEIYPKQDNDQDRHSSGNAAVEARSPISTGPSSTSSSHQGGQDRPEILDQPATARSLISPFSQQLTTHRQESVGNYAFSSDYKSIDDVDTTTPNNDGDNNFEKLRRRAAEVNNQVLSDPLIVGSGGSSSSSRIITTTEVNCNLIIVTVATKTKIVGYCLNVLKQKCSFYTYNIDSLPVQLFFKIFQINNNTSSTPEDGYFSVQNLKFALLLWRKKIAKYNRFRLYTDHPAVTDANCSLVKELRVYINHLQHCEAKSVLVNHDNFMIKPQEEESPMMFGYRRYIQPALYLQSDQIEFFEFTLNNSFGLPKTNIHGTHLIQQEVGGGDDDSFFDSSTTEKFSTNLKKIQHSLQQWENRSCQCLGSAEVEQVPTYIS